ncbi:Crp/Fnr family transcriptional regulator [Streptomyces turgidiscabies]|uniref:Cyclic nucleotide-binding domain protein n=1 Tax=Streptomyces turgidiscabies (strain Car8) TaxID=698760 RepID=L7FAC9_STRT8|nr:MULTISPECIES: Crp/Fnr family transcriptional regulator [Streptomyces]ELP68016.1 cyclic nucleotide-binding domain protein [Streptomyces turgidiscabies Car8]MDX3499901.1 Crp/Fnr family transcriptional regulator [Streptomyces turgidiscabies]GAQ76940.1 CAMP receptor protein [Streptomyces turgidiscabies]
MAETGTGSRRPATFWDALAPADRTAVLRGATRVSLPADEQFLTQGEDSDHLVVLLRGWVKVVAQSHAGYRALLALRGPGELLGEQAGLERRRRSASLHTATPVDLLHLPAVRFQALARSSAGVAAALEQTLSGRLREADLQRTGITEPVPVRLAALLLDLAERCGHPDPDGTGVRITLPLSQDDLAGLVLSSRRTVSRVLEQWRGQGWIVTGRQALLIRSVDQLKGQAFGG